MLSFVYLFTRANKLVEDRRTNNDKQHIDFIKKYRKGIHTNPQAAIHGGIVMFHTN